MPMRVDSVRDVALCAARVVGVQMILKNTVELFFLPGSKKVRKSSVKWELTKNICLSFFQKREVLNAPGIKKKKHNHYYHFCMSTR